MNNEGSNNNVVVQPVQQPVQAQPVVQQPVQQPVVQPQPILTPMPAQEPVKEEKKKKKSKLPLLLLLIILGLIGYIVYTNNNYTNMINSIRYNCTPVKEGQETKLDLNSTLVKDLYSKVHTNIKEDIANVELNNDLKLYLAFRQINNKDMYESNCNLFDINSMEPYICDKADNFTPRAFKEETLQEEIKKLFGEEANIPLKNIQLDKYCVGGFQYIKERGEFVEGYCSRQNTVLYAVDKELTKAVSTGSRVVLTEEVNYHSNTDKKTVPDYLKDGTYIYTFKLDMNYNYILESKIYKAKGLE